MKREIFSVKGERKSTSKVVRVLILLLAVYSVFGQGLPSARGQQSQQIKLYNGEVVSPSEYKESLALIEKIVSHTGADAYRKYGDGSVAYVGKLLYMRYGIIPAVNTNEMVLIDYGYKVHDVTEDGCRILPNSNKFIPADRDFFVIGLRGFSDREYSNILMLRKVGSFTYKTVAGGSRTIPKCEVGERVSKEEYLAALKGKHGNAQTSKSAGSKVEAPEAPGKPLKKTTNK